MFLFALSIEDQSKKVAATQEEKLRNIQMKACHEKLCEFQCSNIIQGNCDISTTKDVLVFIVCVCVFETLAAVYPKLGF